jgi:hypothetical protein
MHLLRNLDDPRRRLVLKLLSAGALGTAASVQALAAEVLGTRPEKLPPGRSIYRLSGPVTVNGAAATLSTRIGPTDTIATGKGAEIVFVVGDSAYILRESSTLNLEQQAQGNVVTDVLRVLTGKLLAVFAPGRPQRLHTVTSTVGIRGTGLYVESDPEQTYFCTCYGTTDVAANNDPQSTKTVKSRHHDEPLYILAKAPQGKSIRPAPFINHTDQELMLIETLVGREPPFVFPKDDYGGVRKPYD